MKCKHCDGDGVIVDVEYGHAGKYMCDYCWGTGVVEPMTEQEYLQTCTTEQLAEEIVKMTLLDKYKLYDRMESAEYDIGIGVGAKKVIVEWLKQPHTNE